MIKLGKMCLYRTCQHRVEASFTDTWKGTMQSSGCPWQKAAWQSREKTSQATAMLEAWILSQMRSRLLRKSILERIKYFVREGQVQKLKKKKSETTSPYLQSIMLGQVSGPRNRVITKSLPLPLQSPGCRQKSLYNNWALTWCAVTPSPELAHQRCFFHSRLGRRNLLSVPLKSTWLRALTERDNTFHFQSSRSTLKKKWNRCFRSVVHCVHLIV